jgi:glycosyltransferase involved in cell wall biosynthesis
MTLALVMIVRNEAHRIAETLASVKPALDWWTIVDTGSTDGTPELVTAALDGVPGELHHEPFVDFATTRNRAFELAAGKADWRLVLSGDAIVHGAIELYNATRWKGCFTAQWVRSVMGGTEYNTARLTRDDADWRYEGVVHETPVSRSGFAVGPRVDGVHVEHLADPRGKRAAWEQHLDLLRAERRRSPEDPRTNFYLAQTLECLGRFEEAALVYGFRAHLGGFAEEAYVARFRAGNCATKHGAPWTWALRHYLEAADMRPHRAEAFYAAARLYEAHGDWEATHHYAGKAAALPYPDGDRLFIDRSVYAWRAKDLLAVAARMTGRVDEALRVTRELRAQ